MLVSKLIITACAFLHVQGAAPRQALPHHIDRVLYGLFGVINGRRYGLNTATGLFRW
jgi:hypothetical protein